jgi:hypothetical protein
MSNIKENKSGNNKINYLYHRYRDVLLFNKNLIISGIASLIAGSFVTQLYAQQNGSSNIYNSILSLATEYGMFFPFFAFLFYRDNKHRYKDPLTGKRDSKIIKKDIRKLFTTFSVSEIVYASSKISFIYQFLQLQIAAPYQTAIISTSIAWMLSSMTINIMIKVLKLFRR